MKRLLALLGATVLLGLCSAHAAPCGAGTACLAEPVTIASATGTSNVLVYTANGYGAQFWGIYCQSGPTGVSYSTPYMQVSILRGSTTYNIFQFAYTTADGQIGYGGTTQNRMLNSAGGIAAIGGPPNEENGNGFINLKAGDTIQLGAITAEPSGDYVTCTFMGRQF